MLINNKPRAYILMHRKSYRRWSEQNNLINLLAEFDLDEEAWNQFSFLIEKASEEGEKSAGKKKYVSSFGDDAVAEILEKFRISKDYRKAIEVAAEEDWHEKEDIEALCALAEESLVNGFYYSLKGEKTDDTY